MMKTRLTFVPNQKKMKYPITRIHLIKMLSLLVGLHLHTIELPVIGLQIERHQGVHVAIDIDLLALGILRDLNLKNNFSLVNIS